MRQEFVTLYGKATIERETLYLDSPLLPFSQSAAAQIGFTLLFPLAFASQFLKDPGPNRNLGIVAFGLLLIMRLPDIYQRLFKNSYAGRIPLNRIVRAETEDDAQGLHTTVKLFLKNGRCKFIRFRKLENQVEPFLHALHVNAATLALG